MHIKENPASRLYDILLEANKISKDKPNDAKFKATWASVFEVEENDLDKILQGIMGVHDLYNETKDIIQSNEKLNTDQNNKYLKNIYNAIYVINVQGSMKQFNSRMTSETLVAFSYIIQTIDLIYELPKTLISEDEKEDLIKNIDKLIKDFIDSDLPDDLKSTCTDSLSHIKESLVHYKIYGVKGLQESIVKATGELFLNPSTSEYKGDKSIDNYFNFIQRINALVTTTESGYKIVSAMSNFIPW